MRWVAASVLACFAGPLVADEAAVEAAWRDWVAENDVSRSTLAVSYQGQLVGEYGIGRPAGASVPVASLSKAITGACVLALAEEGQLEINAPLADLFATREDLVGPGLSVRVADLLTHTSGVSVDRTQNVFNPTLWGAGDSHDSVSALALSGPMGDATFFYNNENYALLGSVIMEVTGQTVEEACAPRVLPGLESAAPDARTGGSLA